MPNISACHHFSRTWRKKLCRGIRTTEHMLCTIHLEWCVENGACVQVASMLITFSLPQMEAPVSRVCGLDTPFPLVYEPFYVPNKTKVKFFSQAGVQLVVEFCLTFSLYSEPVPTVNVSLFCRFWMPSRPYWGSSMPWLGLYKIVSVTISIEDDRESLTEPSEWVCSTIDGVYVGPYWKLLEVLSIIIVAAALAGCTLFS